jgi:hypothetical protein
MKSLRIPGAWFPQGRMRLAEEGFGVRFDRTTSDLIYALAEAHNVSRAEIVRALVNRSLNELERPGRVA